MLRTRNVECVGPEEYRMHRGWEVFESMFTFVSLYRMPRIMFVWLHISIKHKFQLNWILTKQSSVLPTQELRVILDILVESVLNIRSMYAYP